MSLDKVCEGHWQLRLTTLYDQSDTGMLMLISHYHIFYSTQGPGMFVVCSKDKYLAFSVDLSIWMTYYGCGAGCMGVSAMAQQVASQWVTLSVAATTCPWTSSRLSLPWSAPITIIVCLPAHRLPIISLNIVKMKIDWHCSMLNFNPHNTSLYGTQKVLASKEWYMINNGFLPHSVPLVISLIRGSWTDVEFFLECCNVWYMVQHGLVVCYVGCCTNNSQCTVSSMST